MPDLKTQMHTHRNGEFGVIPQRRRRFYNNGKHWFFITRDGKHHGPYQHFREAEADLKLYLRRCGIVRYVAS